MKFKWQFNRGKKNNHHDGLSEPALVMTSFKMTRRHSTQGRINRMGFMGICENQINEFKDLQYLYM